MLPFMGLNSHTPLDIRYAPHSRLGLSLIHLQCELGIINLKQIVIEMRQKSLLGNLLLSTLRWNQLIAGAAIVITNDHLSNLAYMPTTWWIGICCFLSKINGSLMFEYRISPISNVTNDRAIMDVVLNGGWNSRELRIINSVQIYLQVY